MPEGLSYEHAVSHRLYLLSGSGGITYIITDKTGKPLWSGQLDTDRWSSVIAGSFKVTPDIFNLVFSKTELICSDNQFILIPETFAQGNRIELFKLSYEADLSHSIIRHCGTASGAEICFEISANEYGFLKEKFPSLDLLQESGVLLDWLFKWQQKDQCQHIFLYLNASSLLLFAYSRQHELILCNQFPYQSIDDMQYIVLFVLEQLGFKGEQTRLVLLSENMTWEPLKELLEPYFIEVIEENGQVLTSTGLLDHDLSKILNQFLPLKIRLHI